MILVDSLYVNSGGGLVLLKYLCTSLDNRGVRYHLLCDERCRNQFLNKKNITVLKASLLLRRRFYVEHKNDFTSVLCFGNLPAPIKMQVPVYTYFQNINLLTLDQVRDWKGFLKSWVKRQVFRFLKNNTNYWIVQTANTQSELIRHIYERQDRVLVFPFYNLPKELIYLSEIKGRNDYVYVGNYYDGAKGHNELLEAWEILHKSGFNLNLHLTIDFSNKSICNKVSEMSQRGVRVINHGTIPFDEVMKLYAMSKVTIYPSHNESLGLGVIEAIAAGCDVIGADLPYIHSICKPSGVFRPKSADSIANAIMDYERSRREKSELLVTNQIDEFIRLILTR